MPKIFYVYEYVLKISSVETHMCLYYFSTALTIRVVLVQYCLVNQPPLNPNHRRITENCGGVMFVLRMKER